MKKAPPPPAGQGKRRINKVLRKNKNLSFTFNERFLFAMLRHINSGASDFAGAEASGADVNMSRSTINDSLNTLDVGLPGAIGTTMRMGDLDTKGHALSAKTALCHFAYLLYMIFQRFVKRSLLKQRVLYYQMTPEKSRGI